MNLHQRGVELIDQLKEHLLEVLRNHPDGQGEGPGIMQAEVARRAGLHRMGAVELDHTCGELLSLLQKDGQVELVGDQKEGDTEKRWRLAKK